ncbi:MAG: HD-GYP domain-containing protein [bacterium]
MRIVPVKLLTSDMKLAKPIYYNDSILLNIGAKKLDSYKSRLEKLGINYIYVEDEFSKDIYINDIVRDETRRKGIKIVKSTFEKVSINKEINIKEIDKIILEIIDDIFNFDNILANLIDIQSYSSYTFAHSVNVAVISILIGKLSNYTMDKLLDLGIGGLLHDIGKILLPQEILKKPGRLNHDEYKILKEHPRLGYEYLKKYDSISPRARSIILSHHERFDGSGYPKGLFGDEIHEFAKIGAIADVYDALISDRIYRKSWSVSDIIEYLIANVNTKFDFRFVEIFIRNIAIYTNGMTVILSNGQKAIVKEQNKGYPLRPVVLPIEDSNGAPIKQHNLLNLIEELDIIIVDNL